MKSKIKEKWLKFLEGKRKARGALAKPSGAKCCLGHLCELYRQETGEGEWVKNHRDGMTFVLDSLHYVGSMVPVKVLNWSGLKMMSTNKLAGLNDHQPGFPVDAIKKL